MTLDVLLACALSAVAVSGNGECPSAAAISERLGALAPAVASSFTVAVDATGDEVILRLVDDSSAVLEKRLLKTASCVELEEASAVIIAAWVRRLEAATPMLRPPPTPSRTWELGAGLVAAVANHPIGGSLDLGWSSDSFGLSLRLVYPGSETERMGDGSVWWARPAARLGGQYRLMLGPVFLDLRAEAVGALLAITGRGFAVDERAWSFDPGLGATLRLGMPMGWGVPWLAVTGTAWLKDQTLSVRGLEGTATLPRGELLVALGMSFEVR